MKSLQRRGRSAARTAAARRAARRRAASEWRRGSRQDRQPGARRASRSARSAAGRSARSGPRSRCARSARCRGPRPWRCRRSRRAARGAGSARSARSSSVRNVTRQGTTRDCELAAPARRAARPRCRSRPPCRSALRSWRTAFAWSPGLPKRSPPHEATWSEPMISASGMRAASAFAFRIGEAQGGVGGRLAGQRRLVHVRARRPRTPGRGARAAPSGSARWRRGRGAERLMPSLCFDEGFQR